MIREEPYLGLNVDWQIVKAVFLRTIFKVLHGCRQLVLWGVGLSPITSATPISSCQRVMSGTLERLPVQTERKVGTTSSHHGPYVQGYTRATMVSTDCRFIVICLPINKTHLSSDWSLKLDFMKLESLVIAYQPWCGEYVPGPCTHRPSSHGSWGCLKSETIKDPPRVKPITRAKS